MIANWKRRYDQTWHDLEKQEKEPYFCEVKHCKCTEPELTDSIAPALLAAYTCLANALEILIREFFVVVRHQGGTASEFLHCWGQETWILCNTRAKLIYEEG